MSMRVPEGSKSVEVSNNNNTDNTQETSKTGVLLGRKTTSINGSESKTEAAITKAFNRMQGGKKGRKRASILKHNWTDSSKQKWIEADYQIPSPLDPSTIPKKFKGKTKNDAFPAKPRRRAPSIEEERVKQSKKGKEEEYIRPEAKIIEEKIPETDSKEVTELKLYLELNSQKFLKLGADKKGKKIPKKVIQEKLNQALKLGITEVNVRIGNSATVSYTIQDLANGSDIKLEGDKKELKVMKRLPGLKIINQDIKQLEGRIKSSEETDTENMTKNDIEDLNQTIGNLKSQLSNMEDFKSFVMKNAKDIHTMKKGTEDNLKSSAGIFDGNVKTARANANTNTDELFESVIDSFPNAKNTDKLQEQRASIKEQSNEMINKYEPRKEGLFLAGLFSKYKNELASVDGKSKKVKLANMTPPTALDMIKSAGNEMKLIGDELVPSFVANIHKEHIMGDFLKGKGIETTKGAVASLTDEQQASNLDKFKQLTGSDDAAKELNDLYTNLTHDYKARAVKSKAYLENAPKFINLLKQHDII